MTSSRSAVAMPAAVAGGFRAEIQALRAIAVLAVMLFHVWPGVFPGGYVGVDVFFVISGYLITGILFREFQASGRISVRSFYVRRIRRLLPAATLVLLAVAVLMPLLPQTRWADTSQGIVASALYVQNWWLARQAVDYLAAEADPGMLTHFWSLSVEEQYYIFWPLLLMAIGWLPAAWRTRPGRLFASLVVGVVAVSAAYSMWLTWHNSPLAYFSTFTRAWELGVGGLLAVTVRWRSAGQGVRNLLGWLGVVMIVIAICAYDRSTPFPGYAAALPVLGAALVIAAGDSSSRVSVYGLLKTRPFQYFGDISYSLYLWHWPVIIAYAALSGRSPDFLDGVIILVVSTALAHQSKYLVEDAFRHPANSSDRSLAPFLMAATCILLSLGAAWAASRPWRDAGLASTSIEASPGNGRAVLPHPGAQALTDGATVPAAPLLPAPATARDDLPGPYRDRCMSRGPNTSLKVCKYGNPEGAITVMLVGDSHAAQWQPALEEVARANEWKLLVAAKTGCVLGSVPAANQDGTAFVACEKWRRNLVRQLDKAKPDLLLIAQSPAVRVMGAQNRKDAAGHIATSLEQFARARLAAGTGAVAFVRSTPTLGKDCRDPLTLAECERPRKRALVAHDPGLLAAAQVEGAAVLDLTDGLCDANACRAVNGNVVVYRTAGSMTATYARTLAPAVARGIGGLKIKALESVEVPLADSLPVPNDLPVRAMAAKRDNPDLYRDGCHGDVVGSEPKACVYGVPDSSIRVVLAGDSHAAQWLPPLQVLAKRQGWALYSYTKSACAFSEATVQYGGREYTSCSQWNRRLMARITELKPALVVTSQSRGQAAYGIEDVAESQAALAEGLIRRWGRLHGMGIGVLVIADTPWMKKDVPDCLSAPRATPAGCDTPRQEAEALPDSVLVAAGKSPYITLLDFNDRICANGICPAMQGEAVIWRDRHHLTASFTRGFADQIQPAAKKAMKHH